MSDVYFTNSNICVKGTVTPIKKELKVLAQDDQGNQVAVGDLLNWVNLPAANVSWTSQAQVAYVTQNVIAIRGTFTSAVESNTAAMGAFPVGYKPMSFAKIVPSTTSGNPAVKLVADSTLGSYGQLSTTTTAASGDVVTVDGMFIANDIQTINP
jgi:hypothetical protein